MGINNPPAGAALTVGEVVAFGPTTSPADWTDLDLSAIVGANAALVILRVGSTNQTGQIYSFRKNGDTTEYHTTSATQIVHCASVEIVQAVYYEIVVLTDNNGIIEWRANSATPNTTVTVMGFIN